MSINEIHTAAMQSTMIIDLRNQNVVDGQNICKDICEWNAEVSQLLMDSNMSIHVRNLNAIGWVRSVHMQVAMRNN